jgi:hypothetical protein
VSDEFGSDEVLDVAVFDQANKFCNALFNIEIRDIKACKIQGGVSYGGWDSSADS